MHNQIRAVTLAVFISLLLTSCRWFGPAPQFFRISIDIINPGLDPVGTQLVFHGAGPKNQTISRDAEWGVMSLEGLELGDWIFNVEVRNSSGDLVGYGSVDGVVGTDASLVLPVMDLAASSLAIDIPYLPYQVPVGTIAPVSPSASGGSGDYEYRWYLNGQFASSEQEYGFPGLLGENDQEVELIVLDQAGGSSGFLRHSYSVNDPFTSIHVDERVITLRWYAPITQAGETVVFYRVFYREHGTFSWRSLDPVSAADVLEIAIDADNSPIGAGRWDFAVSAVYADGQESDKHSSLDESAQPTTGWYLDWRI